jgi:hypothetical protein
VRLVRIFITLITTIFASILKEQSRNQVQQARWAIGRITSLADDRGFQSFVALTALHANLR